MYWNISSAESIHAVVSIIKQAGQHCDHHDSTVTSHNTSLWTSHRHQLAPTINALRAQSDKLRRMTPAELFAPPLVFSLSTCEPPRGYSRAQIFVLMNVCNYYCARRYGALTKARREMRWQVSCSSQAVERRCLSCTIAVAVRSTV